MNTRSRFLIFALTACGALSFASSDAHAAERKIPRTTPSDLAPMTARQYSSVPITLHFDEAGQRFMECSLFSDKAFVGFMSLSSDKATRSLTFDTPGTHELEIRCEDPAGRATLHRQTVSVTPVEHSISPTLSTISVPTASIPANGAASVLVTVTAKNLGGASLSGKTVTLTSSRGALDDLTRVAAATDSNGVAQFNVRSFTPGTSRLSARIDGVSLKNTSSISFTRPLQRFATPIAQGSLIKIPCQGTPQPTDPCRSVYYYGKDLNRHAFPTEGTYLSWFPNYSRVKETPEALMTTLPLRSNAPYRSGVRLLHFETMPHTYAVAHGGILRRIISDQLSEALYGSAWKTKVDRLPDSLFTTYQLGADITSVKDYDPATEAKQSGTIDDNLSKKRGQH